MTSSTISREGGRGHAKCRVQSAPASSSSVQNRWKDGAVQLEQLLLAEKEKRNENKVDLIRAQLKAVPNLLIYVSLLPQWQWCRSWLLKRSCLLCQTSSEETMREEVLVLVSNKSVLIRTAIVWGWSTAAACVEYAWDKAIYFPTIHTNYIISRYLIYDKYLKR